MAIGKAYVEIIPDLRGIHKETKKGLQGVESEFDQTGKRSGGRFSKGLGAVAKAGAVGAAVGIGAAFGTALTKGFGRLEAIDTAEAKLRGLGHSAESIASLMDSATKAVKGTAFGLDEAAGVAAILSGAGVKAGQQMTDSLTLVADAAFIGGSTLDEMGAIFGKVAAKGKLDGEVMAQLLERQIGILPALADHYNVSREEASKMVSEGKVSFQDFATVMEDLVGGAAQRSGETFSGAMSNLGAAMGRLGGTLLSPFMDGAKGGIGQLTALLDSIELALRPVMAAFGDWLNGIDWAAVGAVFKPLVDGFMAMAPAAGELWSNLSPLGAAFKILQPSLPILAQAFGQIAGTIGGALSTALQAIMPLWGQILNVLGQAFFNVLGAVIPLVVMLAQMLGPILSVVLQTMAPIIQVVIQVFTSLFTALIPITNIVMGLVMSLLPPLMGLFMALAPIIRLVGTIVAFLAQIVGTILVTAINFLMPIIRVLINVLSVILVTAIKIVTAVITGLVWFVQNILAPAFVWLWQNVLVPVWNGIKIAVAAVVAWFQTYVAPVIQAVINALGTIFSWLYRNIILPVFTGIRIAIAVFWSIASAIFRAVVTFVRTVLAPVFNFLWQIVKIAFQFIKSAIQVFWAIAKIIFQAIVTFVRDVLAPIFTWLYNTIIKPVWEGIKTAINTAWTFIKTYILAPMIAYVRDTLAPIFTWFKDTIITPAWNGIKSAIDTVWTFIRDKIFTPLKDAIKNTVPKAFESGTDAIGKAWDKLKEVARKPVEFVINKIINDGIIGGWNTIAKKFGADEVDKIKLGFASGGKVWGPGTETSDSIPARLSRNEHVWTAKEVRAAGGHGAIYAMRRAALRGSLVPGFASGGTLSDAARWWQAKGARITEFGAWGQRVGRHSPNSLHYSGQAFDANYGPGGENATEKRFFDKWMPEFRSLFKGIGVIWRAAGHFNHAHFDTSGGGKVGSGGGGEGGLSLDFITQPFKDLIEKVAAGVGDSPFGGLIGSGAKKIIEMPIKWITDNISKFVDWAGDVADFTTEYVGKGIARGKGMAWATSKGWPLDGARWKALDFIVGHESSWNPKAKNPRSTASGLGQFINATSRQYLGSAPMSKFGVWDQLDAIVKYTDDRYGGLGKAMAFWQSHRYYKDGGAVNPTLYDTGGWLQPGLTTVLNATGKPEAVFTQDQLSMLSGGGAPIFHFHIDGRQSDDKIISDLRYEMNRQFSGGKYGR
ncbi:tape measure domain-containing protein [Brevibacterium sanguinis]|uniref:Tape measure domain-containing protein n=2 Tax=Brevibacterium TaxID=1696 RepID=A0A366IKX9_9MICO|nr:MULTISPECIES: tape measure protein [Brevibacterium]RBP66442.1 tape measure domain-containing protein [Brevibacterium sanguinis]RBP73094.1 tape measure domain-containing protein [Brevibacterium celere]